MPNNPADLTRLRARASTTRAQWRRSDWQPSTGRIRQQLGEQRGCDTSQLSMTSMSPLEVRDIIDIDIIKWNLVNSVEKRLYNHVNIDILVMDLTHQPQIGKLTNRRGATPAVASTVGTYNLRTTGGASHNSFQQHFSEATNRRDHQHSHRHRHPRGGHQAHQDSNNSFWMENSTYNRDYLENNFAHNMVHQAYSSLLQIDYRDCTTQIINEEFSFIINKWFNNSFVIIDLRSSQLHILSSMITHRSIEGGDNDEMYINLGSQQ